MTHPLHAATSFECDGCGHHASFHMLVNKDEDEVVARWKAEAEAEAEKEREKDAAYALDARRPAKRSRAAREIAHDPEPAAPLRSLSVLLGGEAEQGGNAGTGLMYVWPSKLRKATE